MDTLQLLALGLLPLLVVVAAVSDLTTMKIPNWISAGLIVGFFPTALLLGLPVMEMLAHVGVGVVALLVGMGLFALRVLGGGDAKLMAAACLWLGIDASIVFIIWTALAGGSFSLLLIMARSQLQPLAQVAPAWVGTLLQPKGDIPYGVAIAVGALMAFPASALVALSAAG